MLDSRFREVEHLLGISAHDAVSDRVVFSVCGLEGGENEKANLDKNMNHLGCSEDENPP